MNRPPARSGSMWVRLFSVLLLFYPRSFRRRFGSGMLHAFECDLERAREEGRGRMVSYGLRSVLHVSGLGLLERASTLTRFVSASRRREGTGHPASAPSGSGRRGVPTVEAVLTDLRLAFRRLAKSPRFTGVTLLTLALGIGANSAIFSMVHSVLLSPLPFDDPEALVFAWETRQAGSRISPVSPLNLREWRGAGTQFKKMAGVRPWPYNLTGEEVPERVTGVQVSPGILALLRVAPEVGREFSRSEEGLFGHPVCMVSHGFWLSRLAGNRKLESLHLILNGVTHDVVGVLPDGFAIPGFGPSPILTPLPLNPEDPGFWGNHNVVVFGRLADDVSLEQAGQALESIAADLRTAYPEWNDGIGARLVPARDQIVQGTQQNLWLLLGAVVLVLLIACANLASLLLVRGVEAEREMAIRMALGAQRGRIVRLVLSEALVLGITGGLLGLGVCSLGVDAIHLWAPGNLPRLGEVSVSLPVLGFTCAASLGTGLLLGLIPAIQSARVTHQDVLKEGGRAFGSGRRSRAQRLFVVGEVAVAVVLLVGSGLLLRTFRNLLDVDPGFETEGRVALQVSLPQASYPDRESVTAFLDRLHEGLDAIPGVQASGSSVGLPLRPSVWRQLMTLERHPARTLQEVPVVDVSIMTPRWLETLGARTVRGRALLESDDEDGPLVALVNESFVRAHLADLDPLGQRLRLGAPDHLLAEGQGAEVPWYTIVGVVGD
ncbi:MAG: ABC transporter permease, partial [Longimicrobiales bacterium]